MNEMNRLKSIPRKGAIKMFERFSLNCAAIAFGFASFAGPLVGQTYSPMYAPNASFVDYWQCIYDGTTTPVPYALFTTIPGYYSNTNAHFLNTSRPK
jgi:hypothetical protein